MVYRLTLKILEIFEIFLIGANDLNFNIWISLKTTQNVFNFYQTLLNDVDKTTLWVPLLSNTFGQTILILILIQQNMAVFA